MQRYDSKGVIVFPHEAVLIPFMAKLKLTDMNLCAYAELCDVIERTFDVGDDEIVLPVLIINEEGSVSYTEPEQTSAYQLVMAAADDYGLPYKVYIQEVTGSNGDNHISCWYNMNTEDQSDVLNSLGINLEPTGTPPTGSGMVESCMDSVIEDTFLGMSVHFGSDEGDINSELHVRRSINSILTKNQEETL